MENIINFRNITMADLPKVGGKNASLGEMVQNLSKLKLRIPDGFATTAEAYRAFLKENELDKKIYASLGDLNVSNVRKLKETSRQIKKWIMDANFNKALQDDIAKAYAKLCGNSKTTFAVRSSATFEDLPTASFAGQHDSYLNIKNLENILLAIKAVFASTFNERAIVYRVQNGFKHEKMAISAGVQRMVQSAASGVMFTLDTESGFDQVVLINANYGLGETVVQGKVNPDEFYVSKPLLKNKKFAILQRNLGKKQIATLATQKFSFSKSVKDVPNSVVKRGKFCIADKEVLELARYALSIEEHYGRPMDIEWAKDSVDGKLYIVQARPETVRSQEKSNTVKKMSLLKKSKVLVTGNSVGQSIGQGCARVILNPRDMHKMQPNEVLVADMTDPDWEPIMKKASAIITNRGGRTCHAAVVARELGIPAVVGCSNATSKLKTGQKITVSCAEGETGIVYEGILPIQIKEASVKAMPKLPTKICLNLAHPDMAFTEQFLPNDGVGLVRLEFVISNIGIHPNALLRAREIPKVMREKIKNLTMAYANPIEFYIEKLREGISTIAAAFYPKPVIVRFSDFKSNEYANLLGGKYFEPKEENPMLGFRGVSRYISPEFTACFALECEAIKRVRNKMGLTNVEVMLPFLRTLKEAKAVTEVLAKNGLKRGKDDLRVIMMCEIPSNVILAQEFLEYFDGFSVGSNDLTQLTLGLDRDSSLVAPIFDERNKAVKALLHQVIQACKKAKKHIGICGQAPSDYLDFAAWLLEEGIDSISLNPDTVVATWLRLAERKR